MAPSKETVEVAIQGLRDDAQVWRFGGGELAIAATRASSYTFAPADFSYIGEVIGLNDKYAAVQQKLAMLLNEGAGHFRSIADALNSAANQYQEDERNAVHLTKNVW